MKNLYTIFFFIFFHFYNSQRPIVTTWDTSQVKYIKISTQGDFDYYYEKVDEPNVNYYGYSVGGNLTLNLPKSGVYRIDFYPKSKFSFLFKNLMKLDDRAKLIGVTQWGDVNWNSDLSGMFWDCENLKITAQDVPDFSQVTDMSMMFFNCINLESIPKVSQWKTAMVKNMSGMFGSAILFSDDLNDWDTSNVLDMSGMFREASNFNGLIAKWNTAKVESFSYMFDEAHNFNQDLSLWSTGKSKYFINMFSNAFLFNQDISNWNTSQGIYFYSMFENARKFDQNLNSWNMSNAVSCEAMFSGATAFNGLVSNWNTAKLENIKNMFNNAENFNQNIGNWNTSNVVDMSGTFYGTKSFNQNISNWNVAKVNNMSYMFQNATSFNQDIGKWDVRNVENMRGVLYYANKFNQNIGGWDLKSVTNLEFSLSFSGIDCVNYAKTLKGWSDRNSTPENLVINMQGLKYGPNGEISRTRLINEKKWKISGDTFTENCELNVSEVKDLTHVFVIAPNPVTDYLYINSKVKARAKIYNTNQQIIKEYDVSEGRNVIDVLNLRPGFYFIKINNEMQKIIKN
ncbi:BspA family leucine-rich repeat surface protein [Soonwooa sp.]|uniref:BspA family leucine-rich repeat surface protein n=1 Tax=Soonwooa sp. TaxID=1938592 RepID=UPI0026243085|nr:BspA family leucine-rich repeat surface protein [Soonwooa sp.]